MNNNSDIFVSYLRDSFEENYINQGFHLSKEQNIDISFQKGVPEQYFVVSALIKDRRQFHVKISHREDTLTHKCSCETWRDHQQCSHIVALLFHYAHLFTEYLHHRKKTTTQDASDAVRAPRYGKVIASPQEFVGTSFYTTFSALRYLRTDRTTTTWNVEDNIDLTGKIRLHTELSSNALEKKVTLETTYSLQQEHGLAEHISLFENNYLYHWEKGIAYPLFPSLQKAIRASEYKNTISLDKFSKIYTPLAKSGEIQLYFAGTLLNSRIFPSVFALALQEQEKFYQLKISLSDPRLEGKTLSLHKVYNEFSNNLGLFAPQKNKTQLHYLFSRYFGAEGPSANPQDFLIPPYDYLFHLEEKNIYEIDLHLFGEILQQIRFCFGIESFLVTASQEGEIIFYLDKVKFKQNFSDFYTFVHQHKISILYNGGDTHSWNPQITLKRAQQEIDWFNFDVNIDEISQEIIRNIENEKEYFFYKNQIIKLDQNVHQKIKKLAPILKEVRDGQLKISRCRLLDIFLFYKNGFAEILTEEEKMLCHKLINIKEIENIPTHEKISAQARDYQRFGTSWLHFLYDLKLGACLIDDMGLGKTLQVIMFLRHIYHNDLKVLIVCPVGLLANWEKEFLKFSDLNPYVYYGQDRKIIPEKHNIIITSYSIVRKESDNILQDFRFDALVFDEAQYLKNYKSLISQAVRKISAEFRIALTGTPLENNIGEFYNILDIVIPGIWGSDPKTQFNAQTESETIKNRIKPFLLRRTKKEVLTELPEKIEQIIKVPFSSQEKENYFKTLEITRQVLQEGKSKAIYILNNILKLRQLCLWQKQEAQILSAKLEYLENYCSQIMEESSGILIFSQFTSYLDLIEETMKRNQWTYSRIDGTQSPQKRAQQVQLFQEQKHKVALISIKAGGTGLNLTRANYVFLMDPWWNPAVENQAVDRAHRIGQKNSVHIYKFIVKDSIEEKILQLQEHKKNLYEEILGSEKSGHYNGKITTEDFAWILK